VSRDIRRYQSDVVAVLDNGDGRELHAVIEVKGQTGSENKRKRYWLERHWIPAVNAHLEYSAGRAWASLWLATPDKVE